MLEKWTTNIYFIKKVGFAYLTNTLLNFTKSMLNPGVDVNMSKNNAIFCCLPLCKVKLPNKR